MHNNLNIAGGITRWSVRVFRLEKQFCRNVEAAQVVSSKSAAVVFRAATLAGGDGLHPRLAPHASSAVFQVEDGSHYNSFGFALFLVYVRVFTDCRDVNFCDLLDLGALNGVWDGPRYMPAIVGLDIYARTRISELCSIGRGKWLIAPCSDLKSSQRRYFTQKK